MYEVLNLVLILSKGIHVSYMYLVHLKQLQINWDRYLLNSKFFNDVSINFYSQNSLRKILLLTRMIKFSK